MTPVVPEGPMESSALTGAIDANASPQMADVGVLYEQYRDLLLHVACRKFRVPDSAAENLMQEVFLSYMQTEAKVENTKAWLVAAMCNASRHYWRSESRTESMPDDIHDH